MLHFPQEDHGQILIEKSTSYLENPSVAQKIKSWFPQTTIIVLLRNPVDRAISNYFFSKANKLENRPIEEALANPQTLSSNRIIKCSASPFAYIERGFYARQLEKWKEYFSPAQIKILLFENIISSNKPIVSLFSTLTNSSCSCKLRFPNVPINKGINYNKKHIATNIISNLKNIFSSSVNELDREWDLGAAKTWDF